MRLGVRGYALTELALSALASGDEIIWHPREPALLADGWCIVHFSVPETERRKRHQLRAHLRAIGFGNIGTALWIAPARMRSAGERAISELGLTGCAAVFVGEHIAGQRLQDLLYQSWDLDDIDRGYRDFIGRHTGLLEQVGRSGSTDPRQQFISYMQVVDRWRALPFRDPGLPRELLTDDWQGPAAAALFERLVQALEPGALSYASMLWP